MGALTKWIGLAVGVVLGLVLLAGCELLQPQRTIVVTTTADGRDAAPGNGICEVHSGAEDCSLRAAIDEANASPERVRVLLAASTTYPLTLTGDDDANAVGDLDVAPISGSMTIEAPAPGATIDANGSAAALDVRGGFNFLHGVSTSGATSSGWVVRPSTILHADRASLHHNDGAGITVDAGGGATLTATTLSTNGGPGASGAGALELRSVTVTRNHTGLGGTGSQSVSDSIIGDQVAGPDCLAPIASTGGNLDSDGTCGLGAGDDVSGVQPQLGPLTGPGPSHTPASGSPAIDAVAHGTRACVLGNAGAIDQLGRQRPSGLGCERGAVEVPGVVHHVTSASDAPDAAPGNGLCETAAGGPCTLRAAVQETNAAPGADVIVLDVDPVLTVAGADEDAAGTGDLDVTDALLLIGRGRTIDGGGLDRVLDLRGAIVVVDDIVIVGGQVADGGGGVRVDGGDVQLRSSTIRSNRAGGYGGGIAHRSGTLALDRVWVDGNEAAPASLEVVPSGGGGLHVGLGDVTVSASTFSANAASYGGGILNQGAIGQHNQLTVINSTIAGNTGSGIHGGLLGDVDLLNAPSATHVADVRASTVVGNSGPALEEDHRSGCWMIICIPDLTGGMVVVRGSILGAPVGQQPCQVSTLRGSMGFNVYDGYCGSWHPTDARVAPLLGALAPEGGSLPVRRPFPSSPAIDLIPTGTPGLCDASTPRDQIGGARPIGAACDAGAVEGSNGITPGPRTFVVDDAADVNDALPGDGTCATAAGTCTLRAAVDEANEWPGSDAISVAPGVHPQLALTGPSPFPNQSGSLVVSEHLTSIDGNGATVDAHQLGRVFTVLQGVRDPVTFTDLRVTGGAVSGDGGGISGHHVVLDDVQIDGNRASNGGGVEADLLEATSSSLTGNVATVRGGGLQAATVVLDHVVVSGNSGYEGGGAFVSESASIVDSRFESNSATAVGGGLIAERGTGPNSTVDVARSTFSGNVAVAGGALWGDGAVHLASSTISSNRAGRGAALFTKSGTVAVERSTIADNIATSSGGVIGGSAGSVSFAASIVSSAGVDCTTGPSYSSLGYNVGADASCPLTATGDLASVDPLLGPLADNGGPTPTRLPQEGSPVLDHIPAGAVGMCDATTATDQRGSTRPDGAGCDAGSVEGSLPGGGALHLVVDDATDARDLLPGDGTCSTATARCTLRAAIDEANAWPGEDLVTIAPGVDPVLALAGRDEASNATGDLDVLDEVVIDGAGATVSGAGLDRVLDIYAPTRLARVTLIGGDTGATAFGGGIIATAADLALENVTVTLGTTRRAGAGLRVTAGTTTIVASTFSLGTSYGSGGAIAVEGGSVTIAGSALDGPAPLCAGSVSSGGWNVVADGTCGAGPTDVVADPRLGPLRSPGGSDVHLPFTSSPVLDAIPAGTPGLCDGSVPTDARGAVRPSGGACDAGATEGGVGFDVTAAAPIVVTSNGDGVDTNPGDGICAIASGACTLRAAVDEANARPGPDTITFDVARTVALSRAGTREAGNRTGDLDVYGDLVLLGNGSIIDGANLDRVLEQRGGTLHAEQVTFRSGRVNDADALGGVLLLARGGSLDRVVVSGGRLPGGGGVAGAGVASWGGALAIDRSTITDNVASGFSASGGGLQFVGTGGGGLAITRSTITGNGAFDGAALTASLSGPFDATVTSSTIAGGAGGYSLIGGSGYFAVTAGGSIIDSTGLAECGRVGSTGWNVFSTTCWPPPATLHPDDVVASSGLGALAANGGPTPTRLPAPGSAPIGRIPFGTPGWCDATTPADQRGTARPQGTACDAGAVEQG